MMVSTMVSTNSPSSNTASHVPQSPSAYFSGPAPRQAPRDVVVVMLYSALEAGETRFARQLALAWLAAYPGDLLVGQLYAQALLDEPFSKAMAAARPDQHRVTPGMQQALPVLQTLCQKDPEFLEAQCGMLSCIGPQEEMAGNVLALGGRLDPRIPAPTWAPTLRQARRGLETGRIDMAEQMVHQALLINSTNTLIATTHLRVEMLRPLPRPAITALAELYHDRWPDCVLFSLALADSKMESGHHETAVALIHQAAACDVGGQVPQRLWGAKHPYHSLWPEKLEITLPADLAIPARVAAALGWNCLPAVTITGSVERAVTQVSQVIAEEQKALAPAEPQPAPAAVSQPEAVPAPQPKPEPEPQAQPHRRAVSRGLAGGGKASATQRPLQAEMDRIAALLKKPYLARGDGRFPMYVIFTTRAGLEAQYGPTGAQAVQFAMQQLAEAVRQRPDWGALVFYPDEGFAEHLPPGKKSSGPVSIEKAKPADPWSLKLALTDLDTALSKKGQMIGALLIVGGPEIVPFHNLPNPLDDMDVDVPSDNPYGTRDENYFITEWPVGRLPGGASREPSMLIKALEASTAQQKEEARKRPWYRRWWEELSFLRLPLIHRIWPNARVWPSLGYTAAVWRQASLSVYRPVGEAKSMLVSPPAHTAAVPLAQAAAQTPTGAAPLPATGQPASKNGKLRMPAARLGYFNLHGLPDAVEWYGQNDPSSPLEGPDYPVALSPADIGKDGASGQPAPQVIFSEACYGALINGRTPEDSVALKFLTCGCQAVVGSTCTAYGSITAPLAAADLLGYAFWSYIDDGLPAGEALRRARIELAREMHQRQGYLDGEDQKTLISFVMYGDPLSQPVRRSKHAEVFRSLKSPAQVKTVCDRSGEASQPQPVPPDMVTYVRHIVAQYLPGMDGAALSVVEERAGCPGGAHCCPTSQLGAKARPAHPAGRKVVTLCKTIPGSACAHHHYARLTLDSQGKLVKLVVSR